MNTLQHFFGFISGSSIFSPTQTPFPSINLFQPNLTNTYNSLELLMGLNSNYA